MIIGKAGKNKEESSEKRIKELEIEASILRSAYFQLEKVNLEKEEAQRDFKAIFNNVRDAILQVNKQGIIVNINPRIKDILGYEIEDVKGKHFARLGLLRPKNIPTLIKLFKDSLLRDKILPLFELEIKHKNGNWIPIEVNTRVLKKDNKIIGTLNVLRDISIRREIQQKLKKSDEDYRNLVESSNDIIQSVGSDGYFHFVNRAWCNTFGYNRTEALNLNLFNLIHPDSIKHCRDLFKKVLKGEKLENIEAKFINKKGDTIILRGQAGPRYFNKKIIATLGYFNDITEQKKIEEEKKLLFHNLKERVKELTCLYELDKIVRKEDLVIGKMFEKIIKIMLSAWRYPKITCVSIVYKSKKYQSKNFKNTKWCQSSDILINDKKTGLIKVCYLKKKQDAYKGPFLKEEQNLIDSIAQKLTIEIERRETKEKIQKSEESFRSMFELSPNGMLTLDLKGVITSCNHSLLTLLGYSREEIIGKHITRFPAVVVGELPVYIKILSKILKGKLVKDFDLKWKRKDGSIRLGRISASLIKVKGKLIGIQSIIRDITERREEQDLLEKSQDGLMEAQRIAHLGSWDWDILTNKIVWSQEVYRIFGLDPKKFKVTYQAFLKKVYPEDRRYLEKSINLALKEKKPYSVDHRIMLPNKTVRIVHEEGDLFFNKKGNPIRMIGTVQDITERKEVEKQIKESEKKYKSLFTEAGDGILNVDLKGNVLDANPELLNILGLKEKEIVGKKILELAQLFKVDTKRVLSELKNSITSGTIEQTEWNINNKEGKEIIISVRPSSIKKDGKIVSILAMIKDITELKKAEEQIKDSEERLRILFESAPDAIYLMDLKGNFVDGNKAAEKTIGYKREELIGKSFVKLKLLPPNQIPRAVKALAQNILGKATGPDEFTLIRKDGSSVFIEIRSFPVKIKKNVLVLGIARDITDRKKSEIQYRTLTQTSPDCIKLFDLKGNLIFINNAGLKEHGIKNIEDALKNNWNPLDDIIKEDQYKFEKAFKDALKGKVTSMEIKHTPKGSNRGVCLETIAPLENDQGEVIGIFGVSRDITEYNKVLEELKKHHEGLEKEVKKRTEELSIEHGKLQSLVESTKLGIIMIDLSFNIMLANKAAKENLGKSSDEHVTFNDLEEKFKGIKLSNTLSYYVKKTKSLNIQEILIEDKYFRLFLSPVRDIKEKLPVGVVIVMENISEEKKFEKMKNEIISVTSHQLRTPLSVIKGNLEMILTGDVGETTEEQKELLNEAFSGNERMIKLINDLMDLSKIDDKRFELKLQPTKLEDLVGQSVKELLPFANEHKVALSYKAPSVSLPEVNIDNQRIKQVLQNLIDNAVKFSSIDGKGKVIVMIEKINKFLKVSVQDNGIGIPEDEQDKIFERFFRASTTTKLDPGGGTGLGLYIAKAIIEESGGKMGFTSKPGKGTTFYFTIPIIG